MNENEDEDKNNFINTAKAGNMFLSTMYCILCYEL